MIGFRNATNGVHRREDEDPYAVFGSEGLYELAERYSVDNPDPTSGIVWPKNNVESSTEDKEKLNRVWSLKT